MNNKIIIIVVSILITIGVYFYAQKGQSTDQNANTLSHTDIQLVNPDRFDELAKIPETFVLDVHTPEQTHIAGTDAFIPYDQLKENQSKLPQDKTTPILLYCRSGSMSREATQTLASMGYSTIYDLEGGTQTYREQRVGVLLQPDSQDLGTVIYGDIAKTTFTLTNNTPQPLNITKVSTSCGCTSASVERESLKPYESTTVNISFDPAVHKDDTDLGDLTRTIFIETDNLDFPKVTAEITATVVKK
ncbi:hypothetical protein CO051_02610 [Candidatus Roizmanbacteria bacterium CG_4_9_14_0_2_um_filter_39_13]|uniref:Rhodanese domain-containing protein n=2 Tax=Candidatus Roizmaniibacteriota TaxID=1752723 RepID=A0A2M8F0E5_9BACT|nr:MAG: hypothetical protein COY15_04695 [Candidatus Roizmanbacteria bacterium CG_4_10_14_0_2_um_filter_39_12]PJC32737.1 MAG: hypothetical protein CO051_02610 [Candidatus Roizmanbacteria bacterium CG_4_9_14_0_2_um_filter_39_13]PJE61597.1 MAG: hypothetical protein COU87_03750 [Candidatus Roizmanbacteria bacterium CG10_big_fil_rev_8_21_14_0_10_39_12]